MNVDFYFPTPVWWEDTNIDNAPLMALCNTLREEDPEGRSISNNGGWQSSNLILGQYDEFNQFLETVTELSFTCLDSYGYVAGAYKLEMLNGWFNVNQKGDSNQIHTHGGSFISGVYYVEAEQDQSELIFYKNFSEDHIITSAGDIENYTPISGATCRYPPKSGRLILFPSYLPHGVLPSTSNKERVSMAFNMRMTNV
tara:strand:+ start:7580 stop:8173 length:594 start_codon:yes stop_codon:yes gene_type:complete